MRNPREECPYWNGCNAPMCPLLSEEELKKVIWYPDEDICKRKDFQKLLWIRNQKKIKKRAKDVDHYFTFDMLNRDMRISKGIHGLDPDKDEKAQKKKWMSMHKEITEEDRKRMRERAKALNRK